MKYKIRKIELTEEQEENIQINKEDSEFLNSLPSSELRKFAGKYVAVREKQIIAVNESLKKVFDKLDELGIRGAHIRMYASSVTV
ncbi:MAG TPA: hypothetical protein EYP22_03745 [Methanosarcinales archaeon]|nr:hypothetical protein [Methanosarcinales archaeon]